MNKQTFLEQLGKKLLALGIGKEDVDNQLSRFEMYFSKMGEAEASAQIDSLEDMDALAENICELLRSSMYSNGQANDGEDETTDPEDEAQNDTSEITDDADLTEETSETTEIDFKSYDPDLIIAEDSDGLPRSRIGLTEEELLAADTANFDKVEYEASVKRSEAAEESAAYAETISFDAVKNPGCAPQESKDSDIFVDMEAFLAEPMPDDDADTFDSENFSPVTDSDTKKFEKIGKENSESESNIDKNKESKRFLSKFSKANAEQKTEEDENEDGIAAHAGETDATTEYGVQDDVLTADIVAQRPRRTKPLMGDNAPLFWLLVIVTLPISITVLAVLLSLLAVGFVGIAGLIASALILVGVIAITGSALSLFGIIFGIIQLFTVVPAGIYEIGIGVIIAGTAMLFGVLIYNVAIRFLPLVMKKYYAFAKSVLKKVWNHLLDLKKECIG